MSGLTGGPRGDGLRPRLAFNVRSHVQIAPELPPRAEVVAHNGELDSAESHSGIEVHADRRDSEKFVEGLADV